MSKYYDNLDNLIKEYFKVLSPVFPEWLLDFIDTPEIQRLSGISMVCGTDYSKIYDYVSFNSTLDHSVGVALIIWNFTKVKKQTLAGLFHDIATPTFKHCIDFMNGDSEHQESTEERTEQIIKNSKKIMDLLNRDGIKVEEISDYHIYPIADNDTPKLRNRKNRIRIHIELPVREHTCPCCHAKTSKIHDYRFQLIKDIPIYYKDNLSLYRERLLNRIINTTIKYEKRIP